MRLISIVKTSYEYLVGEDLLRRTLVVLLYGINHLLFFVVGYFLNLSKMILLNDRSRKDTSKFLPCA